MESESEPPPLVLVISIGYCGSFARVFTALFWFPETRGRFWHLFSSAGIFLLLLSR